MDEGRGPWNSGGGASVDELREPNLNSVEESLLLRREDPPADVTRLLRDVTDTQLHVDLLDGHVYVLLLFSHGLRPDGLRLGGENPGFQDFLKRKQRSGRALKP